MYITLYIISPIFNVKGLIMDKPHKECGIVGCKLLILKIYTKVQLLS